MDIRSSSEDSQPSAPSGRDLRHYRAKRDFSVTPEPAPADGGARTREAPRFVIHEHSARRLHWDLRLERDGALASWALPKGLPQAPGENHFAAATEEHPLEYLEFHGEIPEGEYGAGTISIWDTGTYEPLKWEPRKVEVALHGERVDARYALFAIEPGEHPKGWMIHRMDPAADALREPMPEHVVPMLARAGELPRVERGWAYEIKWDGVRAIAYSRPGELRLQSRNLKDITDSYPELARVNRALSSHSAVLDGEIVALDEHGRPSFAALQRRMHVADRAHARRLIAHTPVTLILFDLLWLDGHSTIGLSYAERRELLSELRLVGASWRTPEHVVEEGRALLEASRAQGLEGIVAKRLDSTYQPGVRARTWVKIKSVGRQELVVGGWLAGKGKRRGSIGALLLGVYEPDGVLRYVGRVGSGFSERELARLSALLAPLQRESSPFGAGERPPREALFSEPRLVVEVQFAHWTQDGSLRAPVYRGLREDKDAAHVVREDKDVAHVVREDKDAAHVVREDVSAKTARVFVEGRELKLSNLDKVLYPRAAVSKRAVIDYYAGVAPVLLAHLADRPLTVTRWPDGVEAKSFFQKQAPAHRPDWVRTVALAARGKRIDYVLAEDLPTLVWLANLAAIELHVPLARRQDMQRPTAVVFDLDPGAPAGIVECARVALLLRATFEGVGLQSFAKTSGSKGLQVYIPLNYDGVGYERTKPFAKTVAELLEQSEPDLMISRMTRARRAGKVLIDWSQNDAKKTTVCAYSLRASERPTVSTPVEWEEVERTRDSGDPASLTFEADAVLARVAERGDLFAPVLSLVQQLPG
ncbi:MAG TPA: DNA ligase D [Solirubrobacteraceae bacterium]|nr:DNA ligase D [Solirubrobacteraceae bacterium]